MGAPVAWFDITSADPRALLDFYTRLFDWTAGESGDPNYTLIDTGAGAGAIGGGIGVTQSPDDPGRVTIYMKVDDLEAYLDRAEKLGGKTIVGPTDLPGDFGQFALFADPAGHTVGLWS
jgi:predicted enzyme related to lactoylglutathione lyase